MSRDHNFGIARLRTRSLFEHALQGEGAERRRLPPRGEGEESE